MFIAFIIIFSLTGFTITGYIIQSIPILCCVYFFYKCTVTAYKHYKTKFEYNDIQSVIDFTEDEDEQRNEWWDEYEGKNNYKPGFGTQKVINEFAKMFAKEFSKTLKDKPGSSINTPKTNGPVNYLKDNPILSACLLSSALELTEDDSKKEALINTVAGAVLSDSITEKRTGILSGLLTGAAAAQLLESDNKDKMNHAILGAVTERKGDDVFNSIFRKKK